MVRFLFLFCIVLLFSCKVRKNEYGIPRTNLKYKKLNLSEEVFNKIDTLSVYKRIGYYYGSVNTVNEINYLDSRWYPDTLSGEKYLRFYENGKISYFFIRKQDLVNRECFNPKRGKMGRYYFKRNHIFVQIYSYGEGFGHLSNSKTIIKKDTLFMINGNYHKVLIKEKNIPKKWLENWQPDW